LRPAPAHDVSAVPVTQGTRLLKDRGAPHTPCPYDYLDHGGTARAAQELGVDEHAVIKTLVFEDESKTPYLVLMHGDEGTGAAGKVITAFDIARLMALGADWCNSARGFMFALGCIQAQACHTGHCPTGVTTQDPIRQQALVVPDKATRVFNFHQQTLHALQELVQAAGLQHPGEITAHHIVRRVNGNEVRLLATLLPEVPAGALLQDPLPGLHNVFTYYWPQARADRFGMV